MSKKEKSMDELLEKVNIEKIRSMAGVSEQDIAKVEALHNLLRKGKTWDNKEVKMIFGVLPDSFPFCTAFINTEILMRIGKARPIKIVQRPGIKDSRLKWIPVEKSDEYNVSAQIPIQGYEIICAGCGKTFVGKEPFHQNLCHECSGRKVKSPETKPAPTPEPEPVESEMPDAVKPKRRGRPAKGKADKKVSPRPKKSEKPPVRPTKAGKKSRKRSK